ncbi:MAG: hypothetical protein P1P86_12005 [Bacteroidales bacterium]|nr:hypothetical protein [Bacteroidales bacterium]
MKRENLKHIILRFASLLLLLWGMNLLYKQFFFERDLQRYSPIINLVREVPPDAAVIYLGESSNNTSYADDQDTRKISDFIADYYPGLGLYDLTKPAAHAGIFRVLLEQMPEESEVETLIVTMTLRSFNAQWIHSPLETSLQKSLVLLRPYPPLVNRFFLSFKAYEIKSREEREQDFKKQWEKDKLHFPYEFPHEDVARWDRWMAYRGIPDESGEIDQAKTELACHYIKAYGFQIDTLHNPRIADFDRIVELARERGWKLVFNLMAENMEKARELVGEDLIFLMNQNRELLKDYYGSRGVRVVDNLSIVEDEQFIDREWTTEHYAEKGRKAIARQVAGELRIWYPGLYRDPGY